MKNAIVNGNKAKILCFDQSEPYPVSANNEFPA